VTIPVPLGRLKIINIVSGNNNEQDLRNSQVSADDILQHRAFSARLRSDYNYLR